LDFLSQQDLAALFAKDWSDLATNLFDDASKWTNHADPVVHVAACFQFLHACPFRLLANQDDKRSLLIDRSESLAAVLNQREWDDIEFSKLAKYKTIDCFIQGTLVSIWLRSLTGFCSNSAGT
jgi:hypothetical protein